MYAPPTTPLTIGQVLDRGFSLFRESFSSVWFFALVAGVAAIPMDWANRNIATSPPGSLSGGLVLGQFVLMLAYVVVSLVIFNAICARIGAIARNQPISAGDALSMGLIRAPALLGGAILYGIGSVIGFVLLIIPGIWFMVAFVFTLYAVVLDRKGPIEAMQMSFAMVRGRWWRTAALVTIIGIIVGVLYLLLGFIIGVITALGAGGDPEAVQGTLLLLQLVVLPILQVVLVPLSYSLFIALYFDSKLRHEGSDLAARIDDASV